MTGEPRGGGANADATSSRFSSFLVLVGVWSAVILYIRLRQNADSSMTSAALQVSAVASWGWAAILPGLFVLRRLRTDRSDLAAVSGLALAGAVGGWLGAQGALALLFRGGANTTVEMSLAPAFAAQFTAAWILYRVMRPQNSGDALLLDLVPLNAAQWRTDAALAFGAGCLLLGLLSSSVLGANALRPDLLANLALESPGFTFRNDLVEVLLAVIAIPLLEEFIFRFGLIGWLRKRRVPDAAAIAASALLFALAHVQPELVWARGLGGLFMGWLYIRTGRLNAPFLLHASCNCGILFAARLAAAAGWT